MTSRKGVRTLWAAVLVACLGAFGLVTTTSSAAPSRAELERAIERLHEIERDFEIVVERYNLWAGRLEKVQAEIGRTELEIRSIESRMGAKEEAAIEVAVELYKHGKTGALDAVLSSTSLAEMETRLNYLSESEKASVEIFEALSADRAELESKVAQLEEAEAEAATAKLRMAELREEVETKLADQKDEIAELRAAIERAERRRQARLEAAREAAAAAAAAQVAEAPPPAGHNAPVATATSSGAQAAVDAALSQVGKPYQWGAAGPDSYDCSGLTMWAWAQAGVALPHNSAMQYAATARVGSGDWQPGDLLFFGSPIHHVAMYVGNGQMVEAPYTGLSVRVVSAHRSDYVGAGRPGV